MVYGEDCDANVRAVDERDASVVYIITDSITRLCKGTYTRRCWDQTAEARVSACGTGNLC
jgi:hypothetical protein